MHRFGGIAFLIVSLLVPPAFAGAEETWTPVGPYGGDAAVVAVQPRTGGLVAASAGGLLFRSSDTGTHWRHISFPGELMSMVHALLFDAAAEQRYFVAVSNSQSNSGGLYLTSDDAANWHLVPEFKGKPVWSLARFPGDPALLAAGASDGVYLSRDNGDTWKRISPASNSELQPVVSLAFDTRNSEILFAGTPHLPWRTTDGGATWSSAHTGMIDDSDVFSIAVARSPADRVFASACSGMYRSENNGRLWAKLKGSMDASYRTYVILPDPSDAARVFAGTTGGLQRSLDGGLTWQRILPGAVRSIALDPTSPQRLYAASTNGLMRSDDGGTTFQPIDAGFSGRNLQRLFSTPASLLAEDAGSSAGRIIESADAGLTWRKSGPQDLVAVASAGNWIVAAEPRSIWATNDAGKNWKKIAPAPLKGAYTAIGLLPHSPQLIELYAGTTAGAFAGPLSPIWKGTQIAAITGRIDAIATDLAHNRIVIASRTQAVISSGGSNWHPMALPEPAAEWNSFGFNRSDETLVAATSRGLFSSVDAGARWEVAAGAEASRPAASLLFHPAHENLAFAIQGGTALISVDGGRSWRPLVRRGVEVSPPVRSLVAVAGSPDQVFALVAGHGVFAARIDSELIRTNNQTVRNSP